MDEYDEEMLEKATSSGLAMDKLKATEDMDAGLAAIGAQILTQIDPSGSVRRRLWTKADALHLHVRKADSNPLPLPVRALSLNRCRG